jgi:hypothetical protein
MIKSRAVFAASAVFLSAALAAILYLNDIDAFGHESYVARGRILLVQ